MFFKNNKNEYLCENGKLSRERENAVLIFEEMISSRISRFKIGEKYIACVSENSFLSEKSDDSTLFVYDKRKNIYYTIGGLCLTLTFNGLSCCEENNDLIFEYLSREECLYYKFKKEGIVTWQGNLDNIEEARNKILIEKHTRISNLFYDELFVTFLKDETLKYLLDKIYNQKYHLTTYSSNTLRKEDKDGRFFHVDYPYHNIKSPYPDEILGIQVIYALDDFTIENGATMYIPESYKAHKFPNNEIVYQSIRYITVKKGEIIFYRGDIWHSQGINLTENPRVAILANFSPLNILAKDDVISQILNSKIDLRIVNGKVLI